MPKAGGISEVPQVLCGFLSTVAICPTRLAERTAFLFDGYNLAFRFVHTADLHLDSPLRSLALRDPVLRDLIGVATRSVLTRIVDHCITEAVDALLIAGDLYDGDQVSMKTARFLQQELQRLDGAGIATFIIRGNHDALSKITKELVFPPSVTVFGAKAEIGRAHV